MRLLGSGTILREVIAAAELLQADFGISADVWSATSFTELRREAMDVERWNMLHPSPHRGRATWRSNWAPEKGRLSPRRTTCGLRRSDPTVYQRTLRHARHRRFGRSDTRAKLRRFFEVNSYYVVVAALKALADEGAVPASRVTEAIRKYGIDPEKPNPVKV